MRFITKSLTVAGLGLTGMTASAIALEIGFGERSFSDIAVLTLLAALTLGALGLLRWTSGALDASLESGDELEARLAQQQAVARLGQLALSDAPLERLLDEAARAVAVALAAPLSGVLEWMKGEGSFVVRAGESAIAAMVGVTVPGGRSSLSGFTLDAGQSVVMHDALTETRFQSSRHLTEAGVCSGLSTPIGSNGGAYGVLGAYTLDQRDFTAHDVTFLEAVANVLASSIRRRRAEADAEQSHRVLEAVIESTTDDIFVKDLDGRFVAINASAAMTLGAPASTLLGKGVDDILPGPTAAHMTETDRLVLERGTVETFEERIPGPEGERVLLSTKGPFRSTDGTLLGTFGIAHDITSRKHQEEKLARSEERLRLAQEGARMGTWEMDFVSGRATWSAGLRKLHGLPPDATAGYSEFLDLVHPDDRGRVRQATREWRPDHAELECEFRTILPDGDVRWVMTRASAVLGDGGMPERLLGVTLDITERKLAEEELARREETLRLAQLAASLGAWDWNIATNELTWMPQVFEMFALDPARYSPTFESMLTHVHPDDREVFEAEVSRALSSPGSHYICPCRIVKPSGEIRYLVNRGTIVRDADGTATRLIGISIDETDRRLAETRMRQGEKLEAIGQLAGGVAHDFNNLLVAIHGYGELALRRIASGEPGADENVGAILAAADRAAGLTRQLLAFGRRQVLVPEVLDLNDVVAEASGLLQRVIGDDVELVTELHDEPVVVKADRGQLEQVVTNLAVNARDAMRSNGGGTVKIRVGLDRSAACLWVSDDGSGMDAETLSHIFEPFFTTKGENGTGLGLATVHGIVTQSGGLVTVESEVGVGTTFTTHLPLATEPLATPTAAPQAAAAAGTETVLLVEDDSTVRQIIAAMLEERGYRVLEAIDGGAAVEVFDGRRDIPLVISDLMMRGLDGRQTVERVRALAPGTKALYMSGYTDDSAIRDGILGPGTAFIQKPFTGDELNARVRELLDA